MTDYYSMLRSAFLAPANAMMAQPPKANLGGGLLERLHNAIDPVQAMGGYGSLAAMALPPGAKSPTANYPTMVRAYHGTRQQIPERFDLRYAGNERGVFFTPDPETASRYAGYRQPHVAPKYDENFRGANVIPVDIDLKNAALIDVRKLARNKGKTELYDGENIRKAISAARSHKKDFVVVRGIDDVGGSADQIIALNPKGRVKNAITGETMFGMAGTAGLGALLARALLNDKNS